MRLMVSCVLFGLAISGCKEGTTAASPAEKVEYTLFDGITKPSSVFHSTGFESQFYSASRLFVWNRNANPAQLELWDIPSQSLVMTKATSYQHGAVFDSGTRFSIYGISNYSDDSVAPSGIWAIDTPDFLTFSNPVYVWEAPAGTKLRKLSVAKSEYWGTDGTKFGQLIIAYEFSTGTETKIGFLEGPGAWDWRERSEVFSVDGLVGSPFLKYVDGAYRLFYVREYEGKQGIFVASGTSLGNLKEQSKIVMLPSESEGTAISDPTYFEGPGVVYFAYSTDSGIKIGTFSGTEQSFIDSLGP